MPDSKPLLWLEGEVKSPPFSKDARLEAGFLLRRLQDGKSLGMPHSRPMPSVGRGCHELRIRDENMTWRIMYHVHTEAVVILEVFPKKTGKTPQNVIETCKQRLRRFRAVMKES